MQESKKFIFILLLTNLLLLVFFMQDLAMILSFEAAFFTSCLIIFSSFYTYAKNISKNSVKINFTPTFFVKKSDKRFNFVRFYEKNADLKLKFKERLKHMSWFFGFFKLLAYVLLILCFLALQRQNLLSVVGFLLGLSIMPFCVLIFILWVRYAKS